MFPSALNWPSMRYLAQATGLLATLATWVSSIEARAATELHDVQLLELKGRVEVLRAGATTWDDANVGIILLPGDSLKTGPESRASLQMKDHSVFRMAELSQIS